MGSSGQAPGTVRGQSLAISTQRRTIAGLAGASQQSTAVQALPALSPFSLPAGVPGPPASPSPSPLPFPGTVYHRCLALYLCHGQCLPKTGSHILANLLLQPESKTTESTPVISERGHSAGKCFHRCQKEVRSRIQNNKTIRTLARGGSCPPL